MPQRRPRAKSSRQKRSGRRKIYTKTFLVTLTDNEWNRANQIATQQDLTLCEVFRSALYRKLPRQITTVAAKTYFELHKIGVNLNQITTAVNTARQLGEPVSVDRALLERLRDLIQQARAEIAGIKSDADE